MCVLNPDKQMVVLGFQSPNAVEIKLIEGDNDIRFVFGSVPYDRKFRNIITDRLNARLINRRGLLRHQLWFVNSTGKLESHKAYVKRVEKECRPHTVSIQGSRGTKIQLTLH